MRKHWLVVAVSSMFFGALGGVILSPTPANAVSREIVELQQQISQVLQQQQDLRSAVDTNSATLKTLVQQSLDGVNQLNSQMGSMQKVVQEVQANTGSSISSVTQTTQGLSDNLQEVQARVGKLSQQMTDVQNLLQSIDAKVSGGVPASGAPGASGAAPGACCPGRLSASHIESSRVGSRSGAWGFQFSSAGGITPRVRRIRSTRTRCEISRAATTIWPGRNSQTTSRISRQTTSLRTPSFIWGRFTTRRMISKLRSRPTKLC